MSRQPETLAQKLKWIALVPVLLLLAPIFLGFLAFHLFYRLYLAVLVRILWLPRGKDVLFVNSDSPIWHDYMNNEVLPLLHDRAVVLNWSERNKWSRWSLAVHLFHTIGRGAEFNPMVVVFRPYKRAAVFRFWPAFKEWKRGRAEPVHSLRQELIANL